MKQKIGILGGGQLGQMLALSAIPLGVEVVIVDENPDSPAAVFAGTQICNFSNHSQVLKFLENVDVVTYEFENIPLDLLRKIAELKAVYPPIEALEISSHRSKEKEFVTRLGIATPVFLQANSLEALLESNFVFPAILKTCTHGYDGKGQVKLKSKEDLEIYKRECAEKSINIDQNYILEERVNFDFEISIIAVRSEQGAISFYTPCENLHQNGILVSTKAPTSRLSKELEDKANSYTQKILESLNYVGVIAVEYFVRGSEIIFNEFAPRVHNSGHWTIEGSGVSQFENHIRACLGLPLGATSSRGWSLMLNLLGTRGDTEQIFKLPDAHYHWYGKKELKAQRKVGHVNFIFDSEDLRNTADSHKLCHSDSLT